MLSGSFRTVPLSSITVAPDRQRKDLKGVEELAASIRTLGLIHPIVLTPDFQLVAGERRFRAHEFLGLTHIQAQLTTELPREELEIIELEENVKRKDLTWAEDVIAVSRIHELKMRQEADWSLTKTADALSLTGAAISNRLLIKRYMEAKEPLVCEADTYSVALNVARRKEQRKQEADDEDMDETIGEFMSAPISVNKLSNAVTPRGVALPKEVGEAEPELQLPIAAEQHPYLNIDFLDWAKLPLTGRKVNFIHCDFPYGISYDKHNGGASGTFGGYADSKEAFERCMEALGLCMENHIAPSAHIMFWFSGKLGLLYSAYQRLEAMGWAMNPTPLIWHRSDNSGILPDPQRGPRQVYEVCLFGNRGDRKVVQAVSNLYGHPKTKDIHASEKPRPMLQHFFRMFVDESTVMLDPTMGSGNAVIAAEEMGAASVLGLEALPEFYENAIAYRKRVKARAD